MFVPLLIQSLHSRNVRVFSVVPQVTTNYDSCFSGLYEGYV